ncbi:hypothetical protein Tco_1165780 [Tanacetum coccineum]
MAAIESCPKHNMIAYLEKTDGNTEFHEIMDFLTRSLIYYALTISPVVSTTFVEQLWMSAKSKTINNVRYITATVVGKPVTISEASIRSDLLFDDADGIDTLNNQAIFDTIQLMGHLDAKKKFVMYPRFILVFLATQLKNVPVPLDHFPINALTSKVLSFMVKKGKNFSGNVTPLFDSMLVQPTEDEGEASERPYESQPIPSPPHPSEDQPESQPDPSLKPSPSIPIPNSNPEGSGGNHRGHSSTKEIKDLKAQIKKLKKKAKPVITHHKAWMKSVSMKTRLAGKKSMQKKWMQKESISKQGRKTTKSKPTAHKDQAFDDPDDFDEGTDKPKVSTDKIDEGNAELKNGNSDENATPTATPIVFGDDETIAEFLKVLEEEAESDAESEGVNEAERKFAQLANDEEIARKARIEADNILAARLQEEEREKFTIEERAKLLHDTIAAQRRFLAQQRAAEIRSKPPIRNQLRNQMMTYLKHVGGKKHSDLKTNNFEEIQVLYEKVKRSDENFIAIGSAEDERRIKDVNKKATGIKKYDNIKEESKEEESTRKRKLGTRKKIKSRKRRFRQDTSQDDQTDSERENDELRLCLTIAIDEDKEVDYEILDKKYPIIEWKTEYLGTKPQFGEPKRLEEINLNVVIRGNGQRRYFSTLIRVLSIFDREDINAVYQLVMDRYQDVIPEGVHTLMTEAGLVVHMLVEKKYPLRRKVPLQMLELKLESEEDSTMALELIRFVKKLIAKLEPEDSDGNEEDL